MSRLAGVNRTELIDRTKSLEWRREDIARKTAEEKKSKLGQFMTPAPIASFMAGLFANLAGRTVRILDAGAGIGSLTAAFEHEAAKQGALAVTAEAWECDPDMIPHLTETLRELGELSPSFAYRIEDRDFIGAASLRTMGAA